MGEGGGKALLQWLINIVVTKTGRWKVGEGGEWETGVPYTLSKFSYLLLLLSFTLAASPSEPGLNSQFLALIPIVSF